MIEQSFKQVVGARYVPKFYQNSQDPSSSEWEAGKMYEPLTNVTFNMNGYCSKKPVPMSVGNPADNPEYWAKTFDYNAAYQGLQDEIDSINHTIGDEIIFNSDNLIEAINKNTYRSSDGRCAYTSVITNKIQSTYFQSITGGTTYKSLQGVAYDSKRNRLCLGLIVGSGGDAMFVIVDRDDITSVIITKEYDNATVGHVNCFCYSPTLDKYLVTPANGDGNKILVLNAQTLVLEETKTLPFVATDIKERLCAITYDTDRNCYYGFTANGIYTLSADLSINVYTENDIFNSLKFLPSDAVYFGNTFANGFFYYDNRVYVVIQYSTNPRNSWLIGLNLDGSIFTTYQLIGVNPNSEFEGGYVYDNVFHLFMQYNYFAELALVLQNFNLYNKKYVAAGEDLNNYITVGKFLTVAADVPSILHAPVSDVPFELEVFYNATALCQRVTIIQNNIKVSYFRQFTISNATWGAWLHEDSLNMIIAGNTVKLAGAYAGFTTSGGNIAFDIHGWNVMATTSHPISGTTADYTVGFYNENEAGQTFTPSNSTIDFTNKDNCIRCVVTPTTPLAFTNKPMIVNCNKMEITHH